MLNICSDYGDDYGVSYNTQKTVCLEISKNKVPDYCAVYLEGVSLTHHTPLHFWSIYLLLIQLCKKFICTVAKLSIF